MVEKQKAVVENGVQKIRITAEKGYSPKEFQLQKGIPAEITFIGSILPAVTRKFCLKIRGF